MSYDDELIPPNAAALIAAIIELIDPDSPMSDEQLHRALALELDPPATLAEVRSVLAMLATPRLEYRPGESAAAVLDRMRDLLDAASDPPPPSRPPGWL